MLKKDLLLKERYKVLDPVAFENENLAFNRNIDKFSYFSYIISRQNARIQMNLGKDEILDRVVIIKTSKYRDCDLESEEAIEHRREALKVQVDILNDLKSPLLPEPIDYFETPTDNNKIPYTLRSKEPVLVLDYQSGKSLYYMIDKLVKDKRKQGCSKEVANNREIGRIAKNIVVFLKVLKEKGYAYQGLCLKHILLLKDNSIRFLGLGSICKTINGKIDTSHRNFGVTFIGYSAPELNNRYLTNYGAEYATSESVGAFSLGVILHQLAIGEKEINYNEHPERIGEHGQLIYPNGETEEIIKKIPIGGYKLHRLISDLCKENPEERLTDYDEIMLRLENIFDNRRFNTDYNNNKLESISEFRVLNCQTEENKHCMNDNELLKESLVDIEYYVKGTTKRSIGKMASKVYKCPKCNKNKYYIDMETYSQIQESLDEIMRDNDLDLEFKIIDQNYKLDIIDSIVQYDKRPEKCLKHNTKLVRKEVALNYYENKRFDIAKGKLNLKLPVCSVCNKVHLDEDSIVKLRNLVNYKVKSDNNDYKIIEANKILTRIKKITLVDKDIERCISDSNNLYKKQVALQFKDGNVTKLLSMQLRYCKECNKYYINKNQYDNLIKIVPLVKDRLFEVEKGIFRVVEGVEYLNDDENKCTTDAEKLTKKTVLIKCYKDKDCNEEVGRLKIGAWICKCGKVYIKQTIKRYLEEVMKNKSLYIKIKEPYRPIIKSVRIMNDEIDTCIEDGNILKSDIVKIEYFKEDEEYKGNILYPVYVNYCDECKQAYLNDEECNKLESMLDENYYINKKKHISQSKIGKFKDLFSKITKIKIFKGE